MAQEIKTSLEKLKTALDGDKQALTEKEVTVPEETKHSDIPGLIATVEVGGSGARIVVTAEDYEGSTLTFTNGDETVTGVVENGQCVVEVGTPGRWSVTSDSDGKTAYADVVLDNGVDMKNGKIPVPLCDIETLNEKFLAYYSESDWDRYEPIKGVVFDDSVPPKGNNTVKDVSAAGDSSIVMWHDGPETLSHWDKPPAEIHITTQKPGYSILFPEDISNMFKHYYSSESIVFKYIIFANVDISNVKKADNFLYFRDSYWDEPHDFSSALELYCDDDWTINPNIKNAKNVFLTYKSFYSDSTYKLYDGNSLKPELFGGVFKPIKDSVSKFPDDFKLEKAQIFYSSEWTKGTGPNTTSQHYYYPDKNGYVNVDTIYGMGTEEEPGGLVLYFESTIPSYVCCGVIDSGSNTINRAKLISTSGNKCYIEIYGKGAPSYDVHCPTIFVSVGTRTYSDDNFPIYWITSHYPN